MRIPVVLTAVLAALALAFFATTKVDQHITASDAVAVPVHDAPGTYVASVNLTNTGPPDQLRGVTSTSAGEFTLAGGVQGQTIVLPGQMSAQLASDGVHVALRDLPSDVSIGSLIPLTLHFAEAGEVTTRLKIAALDTEDHSLHMGDTIEATAPYPVARLVVVDPPTSAGLTAVLDLEHFALVRAPDSTAHVDGEGHAHLYLNGLKLGRIYDPEVKVGPLLPGDYALTLTLNSHFHRVYTVQGEQIGDAYTFRITP